MYTKTRRHLGRRIMAVLSPAMVMMMGALAAAPAAPVASEAQTTSALQAPLIWLGSPIDGRWSTYEGANTHGRYYGGDWAVDLETGAGQAVVVYAAPQNAGTPVTATVDYVGNACRNGNGGRFVRVAFYSGGTRIGFAVYSHVNPVVSVGQAIARWGTTIGYTGSYTPDGTCWTGPHVHFELYSEVNYACYNRGYTLGYPIYRTNFVGFTGGNVASRPQSACA
jgi:murein DD-endopeptidase MepM/ murein hydrolase activator NlpD